MDERTVQNNSSLNLVSSVRELMVGWTLRIKEASWRRKFLGSGSWTIMVVGELLGFLWHVMICLGTGAIFVRIFFDSLIQSCSYLMVLPM